MSIEQLNKVDFISITMENDVQLTISDHLDWNNENDHLLLLKNKLNAYVDFIENGKLVENYPEAKDKQIQISLVTKFDPTANAIDNLNHFKTIIEEHGYKFLWKSINEI